MLLSTCIAFWRDIPTSVSAAVAALLNATALWVALRARSTSKAERLTLLDHERLFEQLLQRPTRSASRLNAPARKR